MSNGYNDYKEKLIYILRILNSYFIFPKKVILIHENIFLKYKIANTFEAEFKIRRIGKGNDKTESKLILDFLSDFKNNISEEYLNIGLNNIKSINCYSNTFINHLFHYYVLVDYIVKLIILFMLIQKKKNPKKYYIMNYYML